MERLDKCREMACQDRRPRRVPAQRIAKLKGDREFGDGYRLAGADRKVENEGRVAAGQADVDIEDRGAVAVQ